LIGSQMFIRRKFLFLDDGNAAGVESLSEVEFMGCAGSYTYVTLLRGGGESRLRYIPYTSYREKG